MLQPRKFQAGLSRLRITDLPRERTTTREDRTAPANHIKPFDHRALLSGLDEATLVKPSAVINCINYRHFTGKPLHLYLEHAQYGEEFLFPVYPNPCEGEKCTCRLPSGEQSIPEKYVARYLLAPDGQDLLIVPVQMHLIERNSIVIQLPEKSYRVNQRRNRRYDGQGLTAGLSQHAFQAEGELIDFSPIGLNVLLSERNTSSTRWFNPDQPVLLNLNRDGRTVFTSQCTCIRSERRDSGLRQIVLGPGNGQGHQFSKQKVRNPRHRLSPSLSVSFTHPFLGKKVRRPIYDITTAGFSILEDEDDSVLLPGLVLSGLSIFYAGVFELKCDVSQVVYRAEHGDGKIRCGVAILDMDFQDYTKLANILSNALDPHAQVSSEVDLEDLWHFFFETGFIYPKKYKSIQVNRAEFTRTYQKLYDGNPDIVRHFTYQKNGRIFGHISLVRAYEKAWMFHHLSAKPMDGRGTGPMIIKQITHFINDLYRLPSANIDHYICYYQPTNRFSRLLFGGFAKHAGDAQICSQDRFSYLECPKQEQVPHLPEEWCLDHFAPADLFDLRQFYEHQSKGMMLEVLQLDQETDSVEQAYADCGFVRKKNAYSLLHQGRLKAVLLVNRTDFGFNLSNLLNCVKIIVCDQQDLTWDILHDALQELLREYAVEKVPVLCYPTEFMQTQLPDDQLKEYFFWVLNARHVGDFMMTSKKRSKIGHWE